MMKRLILSAALTGLAAMAACGSDDLNNRDIGQPPDAAAFDPGTGWGGDGYGSGGNGNPDSGPPPCPEEYKRCGAEFTYQDKGESSVELRGDYRDDGWTKGDAMTKTGSTWKVTVNVPYNKPVQYKLVLNGTTWIIDPANPKTVTDASNNTNSLRDPTTCAAPKCEEPGQLPAGVFDWRDSIIYFVFVDRFLDGDASNNCTTSGAEFAGQYQGGDWKGVTTKINDGYFTDLGVNTLWLTVPLDNTSAAGKGVGGDPHMYSGYHGYWPSNLEVVESCLGTKAELIALVDAAHAKGIKVLFDYAMVHVHRDSPIYQQHNDWFWSLNFNGGSCICDDNGVCPWGSQGHRCWFTDYLPHWNYENQAARDYSTNNAVQWVKDTKIDGYRLDAIKHVDGRWLTDLRKKITDQVIANQNPKQRFYMVGETYDFGNRDYLRSFIDPATKLDGQFDFPLRLKLLQAVLMRQIGMNDLKSFTDSNDTFYGAGAVMSTWIGNHDLGRAIHMAEDSPMWSNPYSDGKDRAWSNSPGLPSYRRPFERLANAFAFLMTSRGAPLIYYGDEIGLPGAGDPDNRRKMQWSGETADQTFLRDRIKVLTKIRSQHPALRRGQRQTIQVSGDVWLYSMTTAGDTVYVAINRGDTDQSVNGLPSGTLQELVTATTASGPGATIPARQARIYVK
jgi:glycosidase